MHELCCSCCSSCFVLPLSAGESTSPYALKNLLSIGTLILPVSAKTQHNFCEHIHAEDGWHRFQETALLPHLESAEEITFCKELGFLVKQRFISATYHCRNDDQMLIRVYLIPYDLPNIHGGLRIRKQNVLSPAKRYMRNLLHRISRNLDSWNGELELESRTITETKVCPMVDVVITLSLNGDPLRMDEHLQTYTASFRLPMLFQYLIMKGSAVDFLTLRIIWRDLGCVAIFTSTSESPLRLCYRKNWIWATYLILYTSQ